MFLQWFRSIGEYFAQEHDRWLLWTPVGVGIGIATYFALPFEPDLALLAVTPIFGVLVYLSRNHLAALIPAIFLFAFGLGFNTAQIDTRLSATPMLDRESNVLQLTGKLMLEEVMPDGMRLTLSHAEAGHISPERTPVKIRVKLNGKTLADIPPPGSVIRTWAQIGPYSDPVMPGANDFRWQSYFRQWGGLGWSTSDLEVVDAHSQNSLHDSIALMFERARLALAQHVYARLTGDVAAMTVARLNGQQTGISKPVIEAMRIAGLAHLLSTSGFHVTIMGILIYFPLRAFLALFPPIALRYPIKKWAAGGAIISTTFYTLLVGSQAATLRSLLMSVIAMLAIISDRKANALRLVILSAALAMLLAPDAMLGPSFQMSFAAVFALIASHQKSFQWATAPGEKFLGDGWLSNSLRHLLAISSTSLIATAATTPFAIYHFQTFSFYGFIANMLAIPLTSFWVMPCILMAYITAPFGLDGWFIDTAGAGIWVTIKIATTVASWPYSIFYLPAMPTYVLVMMVFGGLWLCIWRLRWRWLGLLPILIGIFYPLYTPQPDFMIAPDGRAWAARLNNGRLAVSNLDRDEFIYTQWQQRLGNVPLVDINELSSTDQQLRCDSMGCVYHHGAHVIAIPELQSAALEDCQKADLVIATDFDIRQCAAAHVIDEPALWHHGAHAIYFKGDDMRIEYVRERRGERPWSVGWHGNQRDRDAD